MHIAAVGVGGAGGRLVDCLCQDEETRQRSYLGGACALDTDRDAIRALQTLPTERRHVFGLTETDGTGTDGDRTAGTAAIKADRRAVRRAIDPLVTSDIDALVLVAGLAGGTGGGATPHIADALAEVYDRPIYTVSVLPAAPDAQAAATTLRSFKSLSAVADGQLLFDTQAWLRSGEALTDGADRCNEALAKRLGTLFGAGEATTAEGVGQRVVDASEIIQTLSASEVSVIGYSQRQVEPPGDDTQASLLGRLRQYLGEAESQAIDSVKTNSAVETTLREAVRGKLTADCPQASADRALSVFAGPPQWLNKTAIADGRQWLERELATPEVRSGDIPQPTAETLSVLVVFSGVSEVPRFAEFGRLGS